MSHFGPLVQEAVLGTRAWLNRLVDSRWDNDPFGKTPHAKREEYLELFAQTHIKTFADIDRLEATLGFAIDKAWLDELALHTQIVKKKSALAYPHGRMLYALLRRMIADRGLDHVTVLETGTARGFSSLCMAKAIEDSGIDGRVITLDVLSHLKPQIWNCIDDHDGPKSRAQILSPWQSLLRKVVFIQGDTLYTLPRVGLDRIHFAFLDAQHIHSSVMQEFHAVAARQESGDVIVFDDVTADTFPGVVKAVEQIERTEPYAVTYLAASDDRAYAWAVRN